MLVSKSVARTGGSSNETLTDSSMYGLVKYCDFGLVVKLSKTGW
jgi:hypothetical protein